MKQFRPAKRRAEVSIGESVRIVRELQGFSQNKLSRLSGIPQATLSAIENDRVSVGCRTRQGSGPRTTLPSRCPLSLAALTGYRPIQASQRIVNRSATMRMLSRATWTLLAGSFDQRTGISFTESPCRCARNNISGSNPNPSERCCSNMMLARARRKALNPHWVSEKGRPVAQRTRKLKMIPARSRAADWCT